MLLKEKIGTAALVERQIDRARDVYGHPEHFGLWANGFIVRRHNAATAALNERWWDLFQSGCERDQISFPVALRESGVGIETIRHTDIYGSEFVKFNWHAAFRESVRTIRRIGRNVRVDSRAVGAEVAGDRGAGRL